MLAIDMGHGIFISNEINKTYHVEKDTAKELLGSSLRVTFISTLIQFLIILFLFWLGFLNGMISEGVISPNELFLCLCVLLSYRLFIGGFKGILVKLTYPVGYIDRGFYIGLGEQIVEILVLLFAAVTDIRLLHLCIIFVVAKSMYGIWIFVLLKKWIPEFFPWWEKGNIKIGVRNYFKSTALAANSFLERFSNDGLNIIVSSVLGSKSVPLFSTTKVLSNLALQLSGFVIQPFQPELSRFYATKEYGKVINVIRINWLFAGIVICIPFILLSPWIEELYTFWTSGKLVFNAHLYALLVMGVLIFNYGNSYVTYLNSINSLKELLKITTIRGCLICGLSVVLAYYYGLVGIGVSVIIAEMLTSLIMPSYYVGKELASHGLKIARYNKIISLIPVIATCAYHYLYFFLGVTNIWLLVVVIIIIIASVIYQWNYIDSDIRDRITNMIPLLKKKKSAKT